jgi:hypothetical protein
MAGGWRYGDGGQQRGASAEGVDVAYAPDRYHQRRGLVQGRSIVGVEQIGTLDLPYVAPWLLFSVLHALASVVLIWLAARCLRRART